MVDDDDNFDKRLGLRVELKVDFLTWAKNPFPPGGLSFPISENRNSKIIWHLHGHQ